MKIEGMNEGVQIIIDRMKTNPEEFEEGSVHMRWMQVISDVVRRVEHQERKLPWLYDEEVQVIYDGIREIQRNKFTAYVLRALASADSFTDDDLQLDLPYMPAIPRGSMVRVTQADLVQARALGVSLEVLMEAKQKNQGMAG